MCETADGRAARRRIWTLGIVSVGLFMVVLDNLVVSVALASIHRQPRRVDPIARVDGQRLRSLLRRAAAHRSRPRRSVWTPAHVRLGRALFTVASAAAALAPTMGLLIAARTVQGVGAAIVTPLTLTLLAQAFPSEQRGLALGVWSGISGIAIALGPLVGGAVIQLSSWHWIFWINVPVGLVLAPTAARMLDESRGANRDLDLRGLGLASAGMFGLVFGLIRAQTLGWTAPEVLASLSLGVLLVAAFVINERRTAHPMLPMEFFARRSFAVTNVVSLSMYFGMFGSIFFMTQYLQDVLGNTPFHAGSSCSSGPGATMVVSPLAGFFAERYGSRPFMVVGLALQAAALGWLASISSVDTSYASDDRSRSFSEAAAWRWCSLRPRTRCSRRFAPTRPARRRAPPTRSENSAASSESRSSRPCSRVTAATPRRRTTSMASSRRCGSERRVLAAGALIALALPFSTRAQAAEIAATAAVVVG